MELDIDANDTNPFRYCGEYYDKESGNIYLRARYYDTANGRFISEDPIKDGLNWYSYCAGDPVRFVDSWGLETVELNDRPDSKSVFGNVKEKETGLYANLRNLVTNAGGEIYWIPFVNQNGGTAVMQFRRWNEGNFDLYKIAIKFDSLEENTYASNINVYKEDELITDSNDSVIKMLNTQQAYFFIEKGEYNDESIRVQGKVSTVLWMMQKDTMYQYINAAYDIAKLVISKNPDISMQTVLYYLGEQPLFEVHTDYWNVDNIDILAETLRNTWTNFY